MNVLKRISDLFSDKDLPSEKIKKGEDSKARFVHKNEFDGISCEVIAHSDSTHLVSIASRMCVGMDAIEDYDKRIAHISKVVGRGHESVLEHTNIVLLLHISRNAVYPISLNAFLASCKYLDVKTSETDGIMHILIGGSIRGYKHIIRYTKNAMRNPYILAIRDAMYSSAEYVFFEDMIRDGVMDKSKFTVLDNPNATVMSFNPYADEKVESAVKLTPIKRWVIEKPRVSLLASEHAKFNFILDKVSAYGFTVEDVLDIARISVIMHDISRPISMQIIRHRNAITQESQRYVDYSDKAFIDPIQFIRDVNESPAKYKLSLFGKNFELTSEALGNRLCKIYKQLIDQGMKKQDARSFLPSNVCTKLIMTFSYKNLFHFFVMRLDKAAQPEIRRVASELYDAYREYNNGELKYDIPDVEVPYYILEDKLRASKDSEIDEVISEEEVK
jgi:flavin-dependent thymidylate synthase